MYFYEVEALEDGVAGMCRNPCYNGRCISTWRHSQINYYLWHVAILVIMEDVFLPLDQRKQDVNPETVAILVIMEDVFLRAKAIGMLANAKGVAILVIMEDVFLLKINQNALSYT